MMQRDPDRSCIAQSTRLVGGSAPRNRQRSGSSHDVVLCNSKNLPPAILFLHFLSDAHDRLGRRCWSTSTGVIATESSMSTRGADGRGGVIIIEFSAFRAADGLGCAEGL